MADEELEAGTEGEGEPEDKQEPDPKEEAWKAERARLEAERDQYKLMATVAARQQQQPAQQPQLQQNVKPDYASFAEQFGTQADVERGRASLIMAEIAPALQAINSRLDALTPNVKDQIDEMAEEFGVDRWEAVAVFGRAKDELGGDNASNTAAIRKARSNFRAAAKAAETPRTAGTGGPSIPRGAKRAETQPKAETFVETIKKDQRKRNLYAY